MVERERVRKSSSETETLRTTKRISIQPKFNLLKNLKESWKNWEEISKQQNPGEILNHCQESPSYPLPLYSTNYWYKESGGIETLDLLGLHLSESTVVSACDSFKREKKEAKTKEGPDTRYDKVSAANSGENNETTTWTNEISDSKRAFAHPRLHQIRFCRHLFSKQKPYSYFPSGLVISFSYNLHT